MPGTSGPTSVSTKLQRIATLAGQTPRMTLTSLAHHIDLEWLREAYRRTRKDGATGIDGQTAEEYAAALDDNVASLLERFKSGTYFAPPVQRVHIPKGLGTATRPIGIPTFEDKVLQRAVAMALEPIYEHDFHDCSYGFRPERSAHMALEALWHGLMEMGGGIVVEIDIKSFFDTMDHGILRGFLDQRMRDGVLRKAIDKWLKAGVLENGWVSHPETGTPQGGVISPLLANIYLHEVLDVWFERDVKPRMKGRCLMVRYADDAVLAFSDESDAKRVLDVLPKRFGKYGLTLHPEKTRMLDFRRPQDPPTGPRPETFDLLGFTHLWKQSRKGRWVVTRQTSAVRFRRALHRLSQWCRLHRHDDFAEQHRALSLKLRGHYGYYGITGNSQALRRFLHEAKRVWHYWLARRSQKARMNWARFMALRWRYPLPPARAVHSSLASAAKP
jgi:RNA-directed DNA polymerase